MKTHVQTFDLSDVRERHEHHVYNAARHQLPAKNVKKPRFVTTFLKSVPWWLAPHIFIIEGDMMRDEVCISEQHISTRSVENEISRRLIRQGRLLSPAVTLGDFVLTGWSDRDI